MILNKYNLICEQKNPIIPLILCTNTGKIRNNWNKIMLIFFGNTGKIKNNNSGEWSVNNHNLIQMKNQNN